MPKRWWRRVWHVRKGLAYAVENSNWATWLAHKLGFHWIDKDLHVTKDGVPVFGHWGLIAKNGFLLPKWFITKYGKNPRIRDVYWADLQLLRTGRILGRRFRFATAENGMQRAAELDMGVMIEYKGDPVARTGAFWKKMQLLAGRAGLAHNKRVVATLPTMKGGGEAMHAAHEVGERTMVIRAQDGVPRRWAPNLTFYRGKIRWIL